jgi:all-trans-8'-apo-beta-carotenal 15,15'-oxygenase
MLRNALDLKQKNVANTNIIYWAGRLLALWEGGLPHRLEADSLRTLGTYTFKGAIPKKSTYSVLCSSFSSCL